MPGKKQEAFAEIDVSKASSQWQTNMQPTPWLLMSLAIYHMILGLTELANHGDDRFIHPVIGVFYFINGLLFLKGMKPAAWAVMVVLVIMTLLNGAMFALNVYSFGEIKHAIPMTIFLLGVFSIIDITRRLRHWDALTAKRRVQIAYLGNWNNWALFWRVVDLISFGALIITVLGYLVWTNGGRESSYPTTVAFFLITGLLPAVSNISNYRCRQHRVVDARSILKQDERRPIILLRSFADDYIVVNKNSGYLKLPFNLGEARGNSFEELVTSHLALYGPVLAIGRPGERLPLLGAAREYVPDEEWQNRVSTLIDESAAIIVFIGTTQGLAWELREISKKKAHGKVLLALPPPSKRNAKNSQALRWKAFAEMVVEADGWCLPDKIKLDKTLLVEVGNGRLYVAKSHYEKYYAAAIDQAMAMFFKQAAKV